MKPAGFSLHKNPSYDLVLFFGSSGWQKNYRMTDWVVIANMSLIINNGSDYNTDEATPSNNIYLE